MMHPTELFHTAVVRLMVSADNVNFSSGSGFFYLHKQDFVNTGNAVTAFFIITNKHVVSNGYYLKFIVSSDNPDTRYTECDMINLQHYVVNHPDPNIDLCAICVTEFFVNAENQRINLHWKFFTSDDILSQAQAHNIKTVENIFMVGYPSGLMDDVNNRPLIRAGITATKATIRFNGTKHFLVDLPCYPGSSGSPVFVAENNRIDNNGNINVGGIFFSLIGIVKDAYLSHDPRFLGHHLDIGTAINYEAIHELLDCINIQRILENRISN